MALSDGSDLEPSKRPRLLPLQSELRAEYPHKLPPGTLLFRCPACEGVYPLNHFARKSDTLYGIRVPCNRCRRQECPSERYEPQARLTEKYCRGCRCWHPIQAFYRNRAQEDGFSRECRDHVKRRRREANEARHYTAVAALRRERTIRLCGELGIDVPDHDIKRCSRCCEVKSIDEFGNDWARGDRKRTQCLDCRAAQHTED